MEELKVEQTAQVKENVVEETTETQKTPQRETETEAVSYGKFKDASALLNAYNSLEAEFTKRCQKIKELEAELSAADKGKAPAQTQEKEEKIETNKDDILKSYVREVLLKKQSAIVLDGAGIGVKTPVQRPRTFEQAGKLAVEILKN